MTKEQVLQKIKELEAYVASIPEKTESEEDKLWEKIQILINSFNYKYKVYLKRDGENGICVGHDSISIYLPNANTDWFFDVMDLAQKICNIEGYSIYPIGNITRNMLTLNVTKEC